MFRPPVALAALALFAPTSRGKLAPLALTEAGRRFSLSAEERAGVRARVDANFQEQGSPGQISSIENNEEPLDSD